MRIDCPLCGERSLEEFTFRGDATVRRPAPDAGSAAFVAYVHERENPAGVLDEYFYHGGGCRSWLVVRRNLRTHEILGCSAARDRANANEAPRSE